MQKKSVFYGTREEWLKSSKYIFNDVYSDYFAVNFETVKYEELIECGVPVEEPIFEDF